MVCWNRWKGQTKLTHGMVRWTDGKVKRKLAAGTVRWSRWKGQTKLAHGIIRWTDGEGETARSLALVGGGAL